MAMVYDQPGKVSIKSISVETPEPGAGQVLIRLLVSNFVMEVFTLSPLLTFLKEPTLVSVIQTLA
jgi:hypothetical protein